MRIKKSLAILILMGLLTLPSALTAKEYRFDGHECYLELPDDVAWEAVPIPDTADALGCEVRACRH